MTASPKATSTIWLSVGIILFLSLVGCSTLPERVTDLTKGNYFRQALSVIQKEDARLQQSPDTKGLNDLAKSKEIFQQSVEDHYLPLIQDLERDGKTYSAVDLTKESLALCEWSKNLGDELSSLQTTTKAIESLESKWAKAIEGSGIPLESIETLKADLYPLKDKIADAEKSKRLNAVLQDAILSRVIDSIGRNRLKTTDDEINPILSDIRSLETDRSNETAMVRRYVPGAMGHR